MNRITKIISKKIQFDDPCFISISVSLLFTSVISYWMLTGSNKGMSITEFPFDDAWIHLVYVRGIINDGVPTYN